MLKNYPTNLFLKTLDIDIPIVAERFIGMLKSKLFQHMTAVSKNVYFDVLDNFANKYNNTVHRTIKMNSIDVTSDSYAEYSGHSSETKPKFKVGHHVKILNEIIFLLRDTPKIVQKKFYHYQNYEQSSVDIRE